MKKYNVYGLGNALVDMEFNVSESWLKQMNISKGVMTLIEEGAQKELIKSLQTSKARKNSGGSAANTVVSISQLGGKTYFSSKIANDSLGKIFYNDLSNLGIETNLNNKKEEGVTGQCIVMVTPDADRTMNTYLGMTQNFSRNEVDPAIIKESDYLYIEGYLISLDLSLDAALFAKDIAEKNGVKVALTFSDPAMVRFFRDKLLKILGNKGVDLLFCNWDEAAEFTQESSLVNVVRELKKISKSFVITCGSKGAIVFNNESEELLEIPTQPVQAIDTTGAGDVFAGGFLYGITHGKNFLESGKLACELATSLVTKYGPRLKKEEVTKILRDQFPAQEKSL